MHYTKTMSEENETYSFRSVERETTKRCQRILRWSTWCLVLYEHSTALDSLCIQSQGERDSCSELAWRVTWRLTYPLHTELNDAFEAQCCGFGHRCICLQEFITTNWGGALR